MSRDRIRNLGITIGTFPTGKHNAITDVPGVLVGHTTLLYDQPRVARTGVTAIVPRDGAIWTDYAFAGHYAFNGNGEMTGMLWLEESGMLGSVIGITNTYAVGAVHDALISYWVDHGKDDGFLLPVVAETYDGWLNDINAFHVTKEHVYQALAKASSGSVDEGNVGGGTGMICHAFKGGIGTASRLVSVACGSYTLGVLVQANYGDRSLLRVNGAPVGRDIDHHQIALPWVTSPWDGSIIVVIATDAPLLPAQCKRLAKRATVGLARVGGTGHNSSGDIFLAFATGNHLPCNCSTLRSLEMVPHGQMNAFFDAVAEAVEEAILNALSMAETMKGLHDRVAYALPLDQLKRVLIHYQAMR
ncbi:P1 family peptidase [Oculatella sp. LEGE 06141]|nr:P1 family peptidase [Oculatella sp. LEGE 06141]MBE9179500.1 P1 family peptidase [Oculatella sp. LEGE 06141]